MDMNEEKEAWRTVETFSWLSEALVLKGMLESAGLEANIPEQHTATIHPIATAMQVRVQVRASKFEEAVRLMNNQEEEQEDEPAEEASTCPRCGGTSFQTTELRNRNLMTAILGFLFMIPMRPRHAQVCTNCGKRL